MKKDLKISIIFHFFLMWLRLTTQIIMNCQDLRSQFSSFLLYRQLFTKPYVFRYG